MEETKPKLDQKVLAKQWEEVKKKYPELSIAYFCYQAVAQGMVRELGYSNALTTAFEQRLISPSLLKLICKLYESGLIQGSKPSSCEEIVRITCEQLCQDAFYAEIDRSIEMGIYGGEPDHPGTVESLNAASFARKGCIEKCEQRKEELRRVVRIDLDE